jgi:superfamily II DNA/RNA helicase
MADETGNKKSRTSSTTRAHLTSTSFAALALRPQTLRGVSEILGYSLMTIVQQQTIPIALEGVDLIAKARTGTGKPSGGPCSC